MIRPVDAPRSQTFGENPTKNLPWNSWLIQTFGNYQPDGHSGEDYACDFGTPVRAVTSGTVLHIGWMGGTYADNPWWIAPNFAGYCAVIDHGAFIGIYGHCQDGSAKVTKGQRVTEGQVFILSGNTGGSTGPHLHFEILPDGYILQSSFYGRIDPAGIFNGITPQGTTTTPLPEDDDMAYSEADLRRIIIDAVSETVQPMHTTTRDHLKNELPKLVVNQPVPYKDPVTGKDTGQTTTLGTLAGFADFQATATRTLVHQGPAAIAVQTNAAGLAAAVRDELVKLIGGK
jgi:murein DD-endopeptidase MepM/ murein hydrolase activator NlpD